MQSYGILTSVEILDGTPHQKACRPLGYTIQNKKVHVGVSKAKISAEDPYKSSINKYNTSSK